MSPQELLRSGQLDAALQALLLEVRNNPADQRRRTFLFELLCFSGQYDRARKHLQILGDASPDAGVGALLYRSALSAEMKRQLMFESEVPTAGTATASRPGTLNGQPFETIEDCDPRIGPRLEVFVAGEYIWLPFAHVGTLRMEPPRFLRDTLWSSAVVTVGPELKGQDFGEVLLPALYPFSWKSASEEVKLGRETVWEQDGTEVIPYGQKLLLLDEERVVSLLEVRELTFQAAAPAAAGV